MVVVMVRFGSAACCLGALNTRCRARLRTLGRLKPACLRGLRLALFAVAPFLLIFVAQVFPVTGAIVQIGIALAVFFMREAAHRVAARSKLVAWVLSGTRSRASYATRARVRMGTTSARRARWMHAAHSSAMTKPLPPTTRIEMLLDVLSDERFLRRPLVAELVEELANAARPEAARAARSLFDRLNAGIADDEYKTTVARLIELAHADERASVRA
jgi:hypothetical protein